MSKRQTVKKHQNRSRGKSTIESEHPIPGPPLQGSVRPKNKQGLKKPGIEQEQYEEKLEVIATLRRKGWSFRAIGNHPKVQLEHTAVYKAFQRMLENGVRARTKEYVEQWRAEGLEELRELKQFIWDIALSSKEPEQEESRETITTGEGKPGEEPATEKTKTATKSKAKFRDKISKRIKGRDGSVHAGQLILDIIVEEAKLRGVTSDADSMEAGGAMIKFFLPATERNGKPVTGEYSVPEPKQVEAKVTIPKKPLPVRPHPSELVAVERKPPLPGSEDIK